MDLGINGCWVLVCGVSKGLGLGCVCVLVCEGVNVVIVVWGEVVLQVVVEVLCVLFGVVDICVVVVDVIIEVGCVVVLVVCLQVDILVINVGGLLLGDFCNFECDDWIVVLDVNMLVLIVFICVIVDVMIVCGFGCIVNIILLVVKVLIDILVLFNGVCSGLIGFVVGLLCCIVVYNVMINNLLFGQFDIDCLCVNFVYSVGKDGNVVEVVECCCQQIFVGCFGMVDEFGVVCVFLCSVQVGYFIGQNLLIDGGVYFGMF